MNPSSTTNTDQSDQVAQVSAPAARSQVAEENGYRFHEQLFRAVLDCRSAAEVLAAVAGILADTIELRALFHFERLSPDAMLGAGLPTPPKPATDRSPAPPGDLRSAQWLGQETGHSTPVDGSLRDPKCRSRSDRPTLRCRALVGDDTALPRGSLAALETWVSCACQQGRVQIGELPHPAGGLAVTVPILVSDRPVEALCAVAALNTNSRERLASNLPLAAAHLALWQLRQEAVAADQELTSVSALLEVLLALQDCGEVQQACRLLADRLPPYLGVQRMAVGLCHHPRRSAAESGGVRLCAISHLPDCDRRSDFAQAAEAAMDEAILRGEQTVWPPPASHARQALLAHQKLAALADAAAVVSSPLRDSADRLVGAWLVLVSREWNQCSENLAFLRACERPVACGLAMVASAEPGPVTRRARRLKAAWRTARGRLLIGTVALLAATMFVPVPYKIRSACKVQPVTRRFVVAPYDGRLEMALVEPGDVVSEGDVLARMDGRELRWELAGLDAESNRAKKMRDAALAIHNVAAAQQAKLEVERLELRIRLLQGRMDHLDIKSPLDGIVISGDLRSADGAPLNVGQGMFEIAPLDRMNVEIAVPEEEIAYVQPADPVLIHIDAYPGQRWGGSIATIFPQSELRDGQSVFLAELRLANTEGLLRPGMSGQAKITGPRHALGWNLFHKPYESLALWLGW